MFLNHYAFLVGIDEYDHFSNLRGAHSDTETLREALRWVGYPEDNIWLVPPEKTTVGQLKREIEEFLNLVRYQNSNPDIVIFWAGHGVPTEHGSFLITRNTVGDLASCGGSAVPLQWLANRFMQVGPASLTMFFDVCHSVPPHLDSLKVSPKENILAPMRDEVHATFVGVLTFAHEVWNEAHQGGGRSAGILADAVQRAVCGEPCDSGDQWPAHDSDFTVTDKLLADKLVAAVDRKAKAVGVNQCLSVLAHHAGSPRKIGFAVRGFAHERINKLPLPVQTERLARLVTDRSRPCLDNMTGFGLEIDKLTKKLIKGLSTKGEFLQDEWKLTCRAILELRSDHHLGPYAYFLLHCHGEAENDNGAKEVLKRLYDYLVCGTSSEELGYWLDSPYREFAIRQALPWSCGIRVLDGNDERGYAPIIYQGAPVAVGCDAQRTFVTTASLQQNARLEVWRADAVTSTVRDLPQENRCSPNSDLGEFTVRVPIGGRVWVRLGLDERGCKDCRIRQANVYVPMKILLGRERRLMNPALRQAQCSVCQGPAVEHEWCGHWHLDFDEGWNEPPVPLGPEPQPLWVARLQALMDDCRRSLEALLADDQGSHQQEQDDAATLIKWLYLADVVTRMWDQSRLEYVVQELIIGLRIKKDQSTQRLARALHAVMRGQPGDGNDSSDDQAGRGERRLSAQAVLADYEQWRTTPGVAPDVAIRIDLMARLLRAVTARESEARPAVEQLVGLLTAMGPEEENRVLADAVTVAAPSAPTRATQAVAGFVSTVENLLRAEGADLLPEQREVLIRSARVAGLVLTRDQPEEALDEFLAHLRRLIGMGAWVLAKAYSSATGLRLESQPELEALVTRLRLGDENSDTRQAAEETYRRLQQLHASRFRDEAVQHADADQVSGQVPVAQHELDEGTDILLIFHALLWPAHAAFTVQLGTRDVDRNTASRIAGALADPDLPDLIDMIRVDANGRGIIRRLALMDWGRRVLRALGSRRTAPAGEPVDPEPPTRTQPPPDRQAEWHDPMLLAVPPGERPDRSASVSDDA